MQNIFRTEIFVENTNRLSSVLQRITLKGIQMESVAVKFYLHDEICKLGSTVESTSRDNGNDARDIVSSNLALLTNKLKHHILKILGNQRRTKSSKSFTTKHQQDHNDHQ